MAAATLDFTSIVASGDEVFMADQWPFIARAVQGLAAFFEHKVVGSGTEPNDVLIGLILGQAADRNKWRIVVVGGDFLIQENTGSEATPTWTTRNTFAATTGITHDGLSGFVANEHLDWTADQGASNIHQGNVPSADDADSLVGVAGANYARKDAEQTFTKAQGSAASTPSSVSAVLTLDFAASNHFDVTLTENVTTVTINNTGTPGTRTILFRQDSTGGWTVGGWAAAVKWPGGTVPVITTTLTTARDVITILVTDEATPELLGVFSQDFS